VDSSKEIDVWIADLSSAYDQLLKLLPILDEAEIRKKNQYGSPVLSRRYAAGRVFLRQTIASYLRLHPADVKFRYGVFGKPFLDHPSGLQFSFARTQDTVVVAVSDVAVGVDLEIPRDNLDLGLIAQCNFCEVEAKAVTLATSQEEAVCRFYHYWTCKESYLKGTGDGLSIPLDALELAPLAGADNARSVVRLGTQNRWTCLAWQPRAGLFCAVASAGHDWKIVEKNRRDLQFRAPIELRD
jgi:4'-phosphopantetheinyl transferase